ncbi:hypothetical protein [Brachybacterium sacelli]|uniref:DUF4145 domain-containing protein n=1 Tax=Brachybacterium sacelli TaxID=173364 RepID=A0ABS4X2Z2_9MICO|nr:hypothetical protein [Brachybacterium sacelli]MBP2382827.1 hypothetical protein [Brachybacterium sacelli]
MMYSQAAADAVAPEGRDLAEARTIILNVLADTPSSSKVDLYAAVLSAHGLTSESANEPLKVDTPHGRPVDDVDPSHPAVQSRRLRFATDHVLHELYTGGVISPASGDHYSASNDSIPVRGPSWGGSTQFQHHHTPAPQFGRWKLAGVPSIRAELAREDLPEQYIELLGGRGSQVLREGIGAFQRGLFIAGVDLLGAASEAAWFGLGAWLKDDLKLQRLVAAGDNAAEVIDRSAEGVARRNVWNKRGLSDLRSQAAHLRDLRNYGLHPTGAADDDLEPAFTEAGCAVLYMAAPRYFRQLDQIRQRLKEVESGEA